MTLFEMLVTAMMSLIVFGAYILLFSFTLWMVVDAAKQDRFWWIVCILGVPVIGGAVYYFTEKKHEYMVIPPHHIHHSETEEQHETSPKKRAKKKYAGEPKVVTEKVARNVVDEVSTTVAIEQVPAQKDSNSLHEEHSHNAHHPAHDNKDVDSTEKKDEGEGKA